MRLQLSRSINALLEERLVLDSQIYKPEDGAGDTALRLKVAFIVDGRQPADTEVVPQNVVNTGRKVSALVATAPRSGAMILPSSGNAPRARASAPSHEHFDVRMHNSSNVRAVVRGQQSGSVRKLLLVAVHTSDHTPCGGVRLLTTTAGERSPRLAASGREWVGGRAARVRSEPVEEERTANRALWDTRWRWGQKYRRVLTASGWGRGGGGQAGCERSAARVVNEMDE